MRLTVLGAGPAYTDREGASGAAYLVSEGSTRILLDLGHGSFQRIFREAQPEDVTAVVVSHLHPDHFIDLVPLRHYLRYHLVPPRRVRVLGPGALAARLDALHDDRSFTAGALDTEAIGEGTHRIGDLVVRAGSVPALRPQDVPAAGTLVDARAPERYRGEVEPVDPVAGHIPGAVNVPTEANLAADGLFRTPDELREVYAGLGGDVAVYCGSGVTAAHNVLALYIAGRTNALLYEGSWSDWSSDPTRPIAIGPEPAGGG